MSQFYIRSRMNGKVLEVEGGQAKPGAKAVLMSQKPGSQPSQLWHFEPAGRGFNFVVSALNPNIVLDVAGCESTPGAKVGLWSKKVPAAPNQMFLSRGDTFVADVAPGLVLDIDGRNANDGATVILWTPKTSGDRTNQSWEMVPAQGGVLGAAQQAANQVGGFNPPPQQPPMNPQFPPQQQQQGFPGFPQPQRPHLPQPHQPNFPQPNYPQPGFPEQPGFPRLGYPQGMQPPSSYPQPGGVPPNFPHCPQGQPFPNQNFPQPGYAPQTGFGGTFIECRMNGKVLDVKKGDMKAGKAVVLWQKKVPAEGNQLWRVEPAGNGWSVIVSALSPNMVLDVKKGRGEGAKVCIENRQYPPALSQSWQIRGTVVASALSPGLVLDVEGRNTDNGANLILWTEKQSGERDNQTFSLVNP